MHGRESIISDLASGMLVESLSQSGWAQQAADMVGAGWADGPEFAEACFPELFSRYNHDVADGTNVGRASGRRSSRL